MKLPGVKSSPWLRYGSAILAAALATGSRLLLAPVLGERSPYTTFFLAVLLCAWFAGLGPALVALALSGAAAAYFFLPLYSFELNFAAFLVVSAVTAGLIETFRRAKIRAENYASELLKKEAELETTLASIGDAVISTDSEGRVVFSNGVAQTLLRCTQTDIGGKHLDEVFRIVNEVTGERMESPVTKVLREGGIVGLENHAVLIARDGTAIPIDDSAAPIRNSRGETTGVVLTFRDVTARRAAGKMLKESEEQFRNLADAIPQLCWMANPDGWIFWYNRRWYEYTGTTPQQMQGWGWQSVHDPDMLPAVLERWKATLATGEPFDMVFPLRGADGTFHPFLTRVMPLRDQDGKVVRWFGTNTDISESQRLEQELRRTNENLSRANEDLQRFAFVASHDLQEPLRTITAYAQLLVKSYSGDDKDAAMFVENIVEGTARMRALLADLLAYTEIGTEPAVPVETVDLDRVVEKVRQNLKASIEEAGAVITAGHLPCVLAHESHFIPLFQNLIANALKYRSVDPPRVHIAVEEADGHLQFSVTDNGIGIDPQYHGRIFEAFRRLHGKQIPGTGIGLAICQRVVERYGGRIWVESRPGQGARFIFTLPADRLCQRPPQAAA